jgi:DNA repair protein RecN (Recombination protein N)
MLRFLSIRHLAVIEAVEVEFGSGLNVLTGETGAGKSMLVEAVGLLLGGRASPDLVRTGRDVATVEAIFEAGGKELILRREITAQGRSRAFVNGALATAQALKSQCAGVIEMHGQHEHQTLLDPATHAGVLDAFGASDSEIQTVETAFDRMRTLADGLAQARAAEAERASRQELAAFQLAELDRVDPKAGEDDELTTLRQVLSGAERLTRLCTESYAALYDSDAAVLGVLGAVWRRVGELAAVDPRFQPYLEARDGIKSQLEDLALFLREYAGDIEASPERLQAVEDRLAALERVKRKYGPTLNAVIAKRAALREELRSLEHLDETRAELERSHARARDEFIGAAASLSTTRRKAGKEFARRLEEALSELAMERARVEVRFTPLAEGAWTRQGCEAVELYLSPNPGEDLRPLARIVSGGELSRVMLAIKALTAARRGGRRALEPTGAHTGLIFDEVDAGIGGRVADIVGRKLRALGSGCQVLCITHLPQIAAYADSHFVIRKHVQNGRTHTSVTRLDEPSRVEELGRMLGGASITSAVRASAREMLADRQGSGAGAKGESERAKATPRHGRPS